MSEEYISSFFTCRYPCTPARRRRHCHIPPNVAGDVAMRDHCRGTRQRQVAVSTQVRNSHCCRSAVSVSSLPSSPLLLTHFHPLRDLWPLDVYSGENSTRRFSPTYVGVVAGGDHPFSGLRMGPAVVVYPSVWAVGRSRSAIRESRWAAAIQVCLGVGSVWSCVQLARSVVRPVIDRRVSLAEIGTLPMVMRKNNGILNPHEHLFCVRGFIIVVNWFPISQMAPLRVSYSGSMYRCLGSLLCSSSLRYKNYKISNCGKNVYHLTTRQTSVGDTNF